jgi:hypothetical protein
MAIDDYGILHDERHWISSRTGLVIFALAPVGGGATVEKEH